MGWKRSNVPWGQLEIITAGLLDKKEGYGCDLIWGKPRENGCVFHSGIVSVLQRGVSFSCGTHSVTFNSFSYGVPF